MLLGCTSNSGGEAGNTADARGNNNPSVDASSGNELVRIPNWTLEDIQTDSAMFGQTYGLDSFSDKILIVVVSQGF